MTALTAMTAMNRPRTPQHQERGTTLVEMLVTMVIASICLVVAGGALIGIIRGVHRQNGTVAAQQSTRDAFLLLDKQIRYANAVTVPATISGVQWIEWQVPDPTLTLVQSVTQSRCYQWRASSVTGTLQFRTWIVPTTGAAAPSSWRTMSSGLVITSQPVFTVSATALQASPFSLPPTNTAYPAQNVQVGVSMTVTRDNPPATAATTTVFTALNSPTGTSTACTEVART